MNLGNLENDESHWLVRSSTRILGPFHLSEIKDLLMNKQVSIIDEIRNPKLRWAYIRECSEFSEIVKNLRNEMDNAKDDTMTMTQTVNSGSVTLTVPISDLGNMMDELTPVVSGKTNSGRTGNDSNNKTSSSDMNPISQNSVKTYGVANDSRLQEHLDKRKRNFFIAFLLVFLSVVCLLVLGNYKKTRDKINTHDDLIAKAIRLKNLGLYEKSLGYYKKAITIREPSFESQTKMGTLLATDSSFGAIGRKTLEKSSVQDSHSQSLKLDFLIGIGISYLQEGDIKNAQEQFQKVLGFDPSNLNAGINLAVAKILKNNFVEALDDLDQLIKQNRVHPYIHILRAIAGINIYKKQKSVEVIHQIYFDLNEFIDSNRSLGQQLLLMKAYMASLLGERLEMVKSISSLLEEPIGEDANYVRDLGINWTFANWDKLDPYCSQIYSSNKNIPLMGALKVFCLMNTKRESEGLKVMNEVKSMSSKDPLVNLLLGEVLLKSGKTSEADAIFSAFNFDNFKLNQILSIYKCATSQDFECLGKSARTLQSLSPGAPSASYGLALSAFKQGQRGEALEIVKNGLISEPNYIPLIELRDQLETYGGEAL